MNNKISIWNGYSVHGDVKELDRIVESDGYISLDKDDIVSVLSSEGENRIAVATGTDMGEAFNNAIGILPCKIEKVNSLLINLRYGTRPPAMTELSSITASLSEANEEIDVAWGITSDDSMGESCKVVLVASVKD